MLNTLSAVTAATRLAARYIPKGSRRVSIKAAQAVVYLYEVKRADRVAYFAIGYAGTAGRSSFHYSYRSQQDRCKAVTAFFASVVATAQRRAHAAAERKASGHTFKVGDIVNTSWGYDQTNVDFYAVTRITAKCVWVRKVAGDREQTGAMSGRCWPAMPIQFTGEESRHVARSGYLTIDGHSASLTTGDTYESWYA